MSRPRIGALLASARLAAWLIALQVAFLLVSFVVPQRGIFPEDEVETFLHEAPGVAEWLIRALSLDHVFTSPAFYAGATLLALNLAVCTVRRIARRQASARVNAGAGAVPENAHIVVLAEARLAQRALEQAGAIETTQGDGESRYYLRRGQLGFIGSIVLHAALILVIAGGVVTGLTTFRGTMVFTEGQTHTDAPADYLTVDELPALGDAFLTFQVMLEQMEFTYTQGEIVDAVARLQVTSGGRVRTEQARVNYPLHVAGKSLLLRDAGHAVALTVRDAAGTVVLDSFVNLLGSSGLGYRDSVELPEGRLFIVSRPDRSQPLTEPVAEGLLLESPTVGLALEDADDPQGYRWVTPGQADIQVGQYVVAVHEVRIWNSFLVRADGGRYITYAAFLLIILGSVVRFLDPDRWVKAVLREQTDGAVVHVWGSQRYRAGVLPREGEQVLRALTDDQGREMTRVSGETEHDR